MDTIMLPQPASAISIGQNGQLAYVTTGGDELLTYMGEGNWERKTLPERYSLVTRLMVYNDFCYLLSGRSLNLIDLRNNRRSLLASDVDDFTLTGFGELWILSGFELTRATTLGRELETVNVSDPPQSIWTVDDSLVLKYPDRPQPVPRWLDSGFPDDSVELDPSSLHKDNMLSTILRASANQLALGDSVLYLLTGPRQVIKIAIPEQ